MTNIQNKIKECFLDWKGKMPENIFALPHSGSGRQYFRLKDKNNSIIAVYNNNTIENKAFIEFTKHFASLNINVPTILKSYTEKNIYFQNDLGDTQVLNWLNTNRKNKSFTEAALKLYKQIILQLINIQVNGGKNLDFSLCYPHSSFDKTSIQSDLKYFKQKFLLKTNINFNEIQLEKDFNLFANFLLKTDCIFFMYRDFQARNIMIHKEKPYFIDYQGGRKGALQYDLASLLYQAKANIPEDTRELLLNYYIKEVKRKLAINESEFKKYYFAYVLIRILQTLGAYGNRGLVEKKQHFIDSIPFAINNLKYIKSKISFLDKTPELANIINTLILNKFEYEQ
ncbi:MAG: hypothetical protein U9R54_05175 [Bacteroidota bacterium]|nr:hypothetical protein [Bacteroidota bacterium]